MCSTRLTRRLSAVKGKDFMSVWDETEATPPTVPVETPEQPADTETVAPDTSLTENTDTSVESPSASDEARTGEVEAAQEADDEVRDDVPLAEIDTKFSNSPKGARSYITRLTERLEASKDAVEFEKNFLASKPADELLNSLAEKSTSRYSDLGFAYWRAHKDQFLQEEFGLSAADLKQKLEVAPVETNGREVPQDKLSPEIDPDDLAELPDWAQKEIAAKAQLQTELASLKTKVPELETRVQRFEQTQQETAQQVIERQQGDIRSELLSQITSHAEEHLAERLGLKALPDDPPEVAEYIKSVNQALKERLFNEFDAKPEYASDTESIADAIERRDKKRALSYVPKAKVTAELVLDNIAKPYQAALRAMRSKPTQKPSPQPPIVNGQSGAFVPSDNIVRGKGVDAVWE